jgi:hypothetical protein
MIILKVTLFLEGYEIDTKITFNITPRKVHIHIPSIILIRQKHSYKLKRQKNIKTKN